LAVIAHFNLIIIGMQYVMSQSCALIGTSHKSSQLQTPREWVCSGSCQQKVWVRLWLVCMQSDLVQALEDKPWLVSLDAGIIMEYILLALLIRGFSPSHSYRLNYPLICASSSYTYKGWLSVHEDVDYSTVMNTAIQDRVFNLQSLLIVHVPAGTDRD